MLESANLLNCLHLLTTVRNVLVSFLSIRTASAVYAHGLQAPLGCHRLQGVSSIIQ